MVRRPGIVDGAISGISNPSGYRYFVIFLSLLSLSAWSVKWHLVSKDRRGVHAFVFFKGSTEYLPKNQVIATQRKDHNNRHFTEIMV